MNVDQLSRPVTRDEAVKAVERCLAPSDWHSDEQVILMVMEMANLGMGPSLDGSRMGGGPANLEDTCDISWTSHRLFGECLHVTHQCSHHPDNPLDRITLRFVTVRRAS